MRGWLVILGLCVAAVTTVRASSTPLLPPPADQDRVTRILDDFSVPHSREFDLIDQTRVIIG